MADIDTTRVVVTSTPASTDPGAVNARTLGQRATSAITANATFLALAAPTNAQVAAQVKTLTKECNALIRLLLAQLADISDT